MIEALLKRWRVWVTQRAIKTVERAGLAVVKVKRGENAVYLIGRNGSYVRFDKVKQ